jgi:ABC-type polysaccharide/polyol phosphate export permease
MSQSVEVRTFTPAGSDTNLAARLATLYRYRGLIYNLVLRELKARYKNSVLGFVWSLLNPLAMMIVFTIVFGVLWPNGSIEKYPLFLLCGLLPWNFFSNSVMGSINSIVDNGNLVKKVYFPRETLPIATVLANLVNFLLAFIVLFGVLIVFRANFSPWLWLLPVVILIQTCFTLGIAFFLSTVNVFYRDTMMIMDVVMLAWFFLTPIFYTVELVPATLEIGTLVIDLRRWLYILNPMASIVNMYRDLLYWGYRTDLDFFLRTAVTALAVLAAGYWFFNRYSNRFGEEV